MINNIIKIIVKDQIIVIQSYLVPPKTGNGTVLEHISRTESRDIKSIVCQNLLVVSFLIFSRPSCP